MIKKLLFIALFAFVSMASVHAGIISMTSETAVSGTTGVNDSVSAVIDSSNVQHLIWTYNSGGGNEIPYYTRSSDSGASWSTKVALTGEGVSMSLVVNSSGTKIYALYTGNLAGTPQLYFNKSTDSGATFPVSSEVLFPSSANPGTAKLAMDSRGYIYAVWHSNAGGDYDIYLSVSKDDGATFSTPKVVNVTTAANQQSPAVFVDENNRVYVTWINIADNQVYMMVSSDAGSTFGNGMTTGQEIQVTFAGASGFVVQDYHGQLYPGIGLSIAYIDQTTTSVYFNRQKIKPDGTIYFNSGSNLLVGVYADNIGSVIKTRMIFNGEGTVYCLVTSDDTVNPYIAVYYSKDLVEFKSLMSIPDSILSISATLGFSYSCSNDLFFDNYGDLFIHYLYVNGFDFTVKSMKVVFAFPDDKVTGTVTDGDTDVDPSTTFSFTFNDDLLSTTIHSTNIKLMEESGSLVPTTISYSYGNSTTIVINPDSDLLNGTNYEFRFVSKKVTNPDGLQNTQGVGFNGGEDLVIRFTTTVISQTAFTSFKAYPNPVMGYQVQIRFKTGFALDPSETKVDIYNVNEERVKSISTWTDHGSNEYSTIWDTSNYDLIDVDSGVYYYRITAWNAAGTSKVQQTGKMLIIR